MENYYNDDFLTLEKETELNQGIDNRSHSNSNIYEYRDTPSITSNKTKQFSIGKTGSTPSLRADLAKTASVPSIRSESIISLKDQQHVSGSPRGVRKRDFQSAVTEVRDGVPQTAVWRRWIRKDSKVKLLWFTYEYLFYESRLYVDSHDFCTLEGGDSGKIFRHVKSCPILDFVAKQCSYCWSVRFHSGDLFFFLIFGVNSFLIFSIPSNRGMISEILRLCSLLFIRPSFFDVETNFHILLTRISR